jgi:hypothetical protein
MIAPVLVMDVVVAALHRVVDALVHVVARAPVVVTRDARAHVAVDVVADAVVHALVALLVVPDVLAHVHLLATNHASRDVVTGVKQPVTLHVEDNVLVHVIINVVKDANLTVIQDASIAVVVYVLIPARVLVWWNALVLQLEVSPKEIFKPMLE